MQCEILTAASQNNFSNISYFSFEELEDNIPESEIASLLKQSLRESEDKENWKAQFTLIDTLRALNKHHNLVLSKDLSTFTSFLANSIQSLRSNICKNSLLLLQELFGRNASVHAIESEFLCRILPLIYEKAVNDKLFIRNEAKKVIDQVEEFLYGNEVALRLLGDLVFDKNFHVGEEAAVSFAKLVKRNAKAEEALKFDIKALFSDEAGKSEPLGSLLTNLAKMLAGKRALFKNKAAEIVSALGKYVPRESLERCCALCLSKAEVASILAKLEDKAKAKGNAKSEEFKNFMKNMKKSSNAGEEKENLLVDEGRE